MGVEVEICCESDVWDALACRLSLGRTMVCPGFLQCLASSAGAAMCVGAVALGGTPRVRLMLSTHLQHPAPSVSLLSKARN